MYIICLITSTLLFAYAYWRFKNIEALSQCNVIDNPDRNLYIPEGLEKFYQGPKKFKGYQGYEAKASLRASMIINSVIIVFLVGMSLYLHFNGSSSYNHKASWTIPYAFYILVPMCIFAEIVVRCKARNLFQQA